MRVTVIHNGDDTGKALAQRVTALGFEVTEQQAVWPDFFNAVHLPFTPGTYRRPDAEQPELIVVEGSSDPSVGREVSGYLGETGFTRHIPVYLVDHPDNELPRAQRRAPKANIVTIGQLETDLAKLPSAGAAADANDD